MAKKPPRKKQPLSKSSLREMRIRKEKELSPSWRLASLLVAMSHLRKHTYMTEDEMANQLEGVSRRQIQNSLRYLLALEPKIFDKKAPKGVHRPNQYHRALLPNETPEEFVYRVQTHPKMDLCFGMHWVSIGEAKDTGVAEFSARKLWPNRSEEAFRQARIKMDELGYFMVDPASDRSRPTRYILNEAKFAEVVVEQETTKPTEKKVTSTKQKKIEQEIARKDEEHRQREAWEKARKEEQERAEQERRQRLAASEGVNLEGKTVRVTASTMEATKPKKRVISISLEPTKPKIDENDL